MCSREQLLDLLDDGAISQHLGQMHKLSLKPVLALNFFFY